MSAPRSQRGAASLVVAMVLLFGMTLVAFFANRSFIFEQRTSANQYRSTKAFELAEAGIEWAIANLNQQANLAAAPSCNLLASGTASFRDRYIAPSPADAAAGHPTGWFNVTTAAYPGCRVDRATNTPSCDCPTAGAAALGGADTNDPRFRVRFITVASDPTAVEIISRGCTNGDPCDPSSTGVPTASDATAVVRVIVKVVPTFPNGPAAALTTGAAALTGGNINIINTNAPSNGITIHSGSAVIEGAGTNVTTLPGTPPRNSVLDADPTLAALTAAGPDAFFSAFFGKNIASYKADATIIDCASLSATACGSALVAKIGTGPDVYYVNGDITFNNGNVPSGSLGSSTKPVTIVCNGAMEFKSNLTGYGVFYSETAAWDYDGSGSGTIFGAFIARGNFVKGTGTLNLVYDPSLWGNTKAPGGLLVRVPGSWRDSAGDL